MKKSARQTTIDEHQNGTTNAQWQINVKVGWAKRSIRRRTYHGVISTLSRKCSEKL